MIQLVITLLIYIFLLRKFKKYDILTAIKKKEIYSICDEPICF